MSKTFLEYENPLLTVMVQADNPDRIKELMDKSEPNGAEAFGMQFEKLNPKYRNKDVYKELFSHSDKPTYVTNYRIVHNAEKSDDEIANEIVEFAECGATLCDIMGDLFDRQPDEVAVSETAINKQMELIDTLHKKGAEVLISTHILKYTPAERVLEIALEHQRRGADISKIVTGAETMEQQLENLKIVNMLKENLKIPFLFLSGGESQILRRIGTEIGNCMCLCVYERDKMATIHQPLLKNVKLIRENMKYE